MDLTDANLISEFAVESQEGLANIEQQMLAIEAAGGDIDVDLVNAVFRTMHSIKGTAGFLGLDRIGTLAHGLEGVLDDMRNREIVPSSELVTTVLRAADFMKGLIDAIDSSNEADITGHVSALQEVRAGAKPVSPCDVASPCAIETPAKPQVEAAAPAIVPTPISEAVREFVIESRDNLDEMDHDLLAMEQTPTSTNLLRGIFRTMHTIKGGAGFLGLGKLEKLAHVAENLLGKLRDGLMSPTTDVIGALLATVDQCRSGLLLLERQGSDDGFDPGAVVLQLLAVHPESQETQSALSSVQAAPPVQQSTGQHTSPAAIVSHPAKPQGEAAVAPVVPSLAAASTSAPTLPATFGAAASEAGIDKSAAPVGDTTIRVDVGLLDKLMTRVGELVLARNQIVQYTSRLEDSSFISTAQRLNLITTELQESVMKTRMQPIGNVWAKFPRVVRDLSSQLGKQVRIEMEGKETELDKTIIESIKDPLTHLVRNSVDHGIESPQVRKAAGKHEEGRLLLRAYHEGGQVNIEITDDGAGLNLDRIRKKAIEKGLINGDQAARMSDREAALLILLPGFSTAEKVTNVSGRGVGMDVVKTNIEKIGGTLDLQSRPGLGTTVKIKIPLTLAIIPALIVTTGGDRYAIPQVSLLELVRLDGEHVRRSIEYVHGAPVYRLRGKLLPLVDLAERLGLTPTHANADQAAADRVVNIVVLRANDRQYGLVVDKVNDTEEIVVKPLSRQLKGISEYAGTTIMGDGTVALILDVMGLAIASGVAAEIRDQPHASAGKDDAHSGENTQTLLVVDFGDSRRFALPISMVARLEKVAASAIEHADGREVIQYRGAILPLVSLSNVFGAKQNEPQAEFLQIVVYAEQDHHCGFVVSRILDIVETELRLQTKNAVSDNLLGTAIIQQRVTDVLNLRNLARLATGQAEAIQS